MVGNGLVGHAAETAEYKDIPKSLGHSQNNLLQGNDFALGGGFRMSLCSEVESIELAPTTVAAVIVEEKIACDLEKESLWLENFGGLGLAQEP